MNRTRLEVTIHRWLFIGGRKQPDMAVDEPW